MKSFYIVTGRPALSLSFFLLARLAKWPNGIVIVVLSSIFEVVSSNPIRNCVGKCTMISLVEVLALASKPTRCSLRFPIVLVLVSYISAHACFYWLKRYAKTKI